MIQQYTRMKVADNSGAKEIMCILVPGGTRRRYARVGDIIIASDNYGPTREFEWRCHLFLLFQTMDQLHSAAPMKNVNAPTARERSDEFLKISGQ